MLTDNGYYLYLGVLFVLSAISVIGKMTKGNGRRFLSLLFCCTFVSEVFAEILSRVIHNNLMVYHCFNPIQFLLISLYYNSIIPEFRRKKTGFYIGILGIMFALTNSLFIQTVNEFNSNYLLFESILIIAMSLHSFYSIIKRDDIDILKHEPFWISLVFLLFWSITYTYWGLGYAFDTSEGHIFWIMIDILWIVNMLTYMGFAVIIILGKKNKLLNEN
jgi:hypothetical protein